MTNADQIFEQYKGDVVSVDTGESKLLFPFVPAPVTLTPGGTRYLKGSGVALIGRTLSNLDTVKDFIEGFDDQEGFDDYLNDPVILDSGERLAKFAGQLCYMSMGENRTKNAEGGKYFRNIKVQRHGSVFEHVNYTFLFYGLSRSMTHELVRHRLASYSQVSQRYVGGNVLRFVERPEYQKHPRLHARFESKIDADAKYYEDTCDALIALAGEGDAALSSDKKTEARKRVRQCARESLPNATEAPIVVTANWRTWRHILDMRGSSAAEPEIRGLAVKTFACLAQIDTMFWDDIATAKHDDGTYVIDAEFKKI